MEKLEKKGYPHIDKPWLKFYSKSFLEKPLPKMTICDYMKKNTENCSDRTAISYYGKQETYSELYKNIDLASRVLQNIGVEKNDRIMYLLPNLPETAHLMYGGSQIGAISDYIDPRPDSIDLSVSAKKVLALFKDENAKYLVALEQCYLGMIKPIEQELKDMGVEKIVIVSASDSMNIMSKLQYLSEITKFDGIKQAKSKLKKMKAMSDLLKQATSSSPIEILQYSDLLKESMYGNINRVEYTPDKLDIIVHTSGTSSPKPKPIPLTNDNLNAYVHQTFGANMPMEPGDKVLHILPYFAAFGVVDVVHAGFCHSNDLIQIPEFSSANLGKLILKYKPQTIIGPPTWFLSMLDDPVLKNADLSFIKMITYGGESMEIKDELALNEFLANHNCPCKITKGHGMSEICGCGSYAINDYNILGTLGVPMPNTTYGVVDYKTKTPLKFEEGQEYIQGEAIISSKMSTSGVLDGKIIVPHAEYDGEDYIYTNDIIQMNRDGVMTFLSRSDRAFTRYDGFKVKPYEIENVLKKDQNIRYCVVTPYKDKTKMGNMPIAHIVFNNDVQLTEEERVTYVEQLIHELFVNNPDVSSRQIPSKFRIREIMPLTPNGKIDYNAIAKEGLSGDEITVELEETNISIGEIKVYSADNKSKKLVKRKS